MSRGTWARSPVGRDDGRSPRPDTGSVAHLGTDDRSTPRVRIVDAALRCIAQQGIQRATIEDLSRQAGVSRATLYRTFPGGKEAVLAAVVETERARLFADLAVAMGEARDLEDSLVAGICEAARWFSSHRALGYLLSEEPAQVVTHLAFSEFDRFLETASSFGAPFFGRWLNPDQAARAAEWATRLVVSYLMCPAPDADLTDPGHVRRLVSRFVVPGLQALRMADEIDHDQHTPGQDAAKKG